MFSCEFYETSRNTFFTENLWTTASKFTWISLANLSSVMLYLHFYNTESPFRGLVFNYVPMYHYKNVIILIVSWYMRVFDQMCNCCSNTSNLTFDPHFFILNKQDLTVCSYRVTYAFQCESTLDSCLNFKEFLARSRREI